MWLRARLFTSRQIFCFSFHGLKMDFSTRMRAKWSTRFWLYRTSYRRGAFHRFLSSPNEFSKFHSVQ